MSKRVFHAPCRVLHALSVLVEVYPHGLQVLHPLPHERGSIVGRAGLVHMDVHQHPRDRERYRPVLKRIHELDPPAAYGERQTSAR